MKIARLDNLERQDDIFLGGESDKRYFRRQLIVVSDDYDFNGNPSTDVTNIENLTSMYNHSKINYVDYRISLISYMEGTTFSSLSDNNKLIVSQNFVVDKTDRESVLTSDELKTYAKDVQIHIDVAEKDISYENNSIILVNKDNIPNILGPYSDVVSSDDPTSTVSKVFKNKVNLTTPIISDGTYKITWYFEMSTDTKGEIDCEVLLDGGVIFNINTKESDESVSGFVYKTLSDGVHTIDIDYKAKKGTVTIKMATIEITKII